MILNDSAFNISSSSKLTVALTNGYGWPFDQINHIRELHMFFFSLSWFDLCMSWCFGEIWLGELVYSWINYGMLFIS